MATTIQVQEDTLQALKRLQRQIHVDTYDALLKILIQKAQRPHTSFWDKGGKVSKEVFMKDLRDKHDRY